MKQKVRMIEGEKEFLFVDHGVINIGESYAKLDSEGKVYEHSLIADSIIEGDNNFRILAKSENPGWFATGETFIKKFIRAELRPGFIQKILENNGECELEVSVETKTYGTNDRNLYEADSHVPFMINNLPVIYI